MRYVQTTKDEIAKNEQVVEQTEKQLNAITLLSDQLKIKLADSNS